MSCYRVSGHSELDRIVQEEGKGLPLIPKFKTEGKRTEPKLGKRSRRKMGSDPVQSCLELWIELDNKRIKREEEEKSLGH